MSNPAPPKVIPSAPAPKVNAVRRPVTSQSPTVSWAGTVAGGYRWKVPNASDWLDTRTGNGTCNIYEVITHNVYPSFTFKSYNVKDQSFLKNKGNLFSRIKCDSNRHFYVSQVVDLWMAKQAPHVPIANDA